MIESSKRLTAVFHMTPAVHCVGDIGCDHGYISHALLETNRAEKVIATDISAPSLNKAATLLTGVFAAVSKPAWVTVSALSPREKFKGPLLWVWAAN